MSAQRLFSLFINEKDINVTVKCNICIGKPRELCTVKNS